MENATELAAEMLSNKLLMHLITERAKRGEAITEETILAALADERAVIIRNLAYIDKSGIGNNRPECARTLRLAAANDTMALDTGETQGVRMTCPNCRKLATVEHLQANPECATAVQSLCGLYRVSKRKSHTPAGGRPRTKPRCACGAMTLDRAAKRKHQCGTTSTHAK